jgi:hypothetical protein
VPWMHALAYAGAYGRGRVTPSLLQSKRLLARYCPGSGWYPVISALAAAGLAVMVVANAVRILSARNARASRCLPTLVPVTRSPPVRRRLQELIDARFLFALRRVVSARPSSAPEGWPFGPGALPRAMSLGPTPAHCVYG